MSSWAIVAIVAISVWGFVQLVRARHGYSRHRGPRRDGDENETPRQDASTQRELEELRDRVKVLEKITVDGREARAIADEIERLRDR